MVNKNTRKKIVLNHLLYYNLNISNKYCFFKLQSIDILYNIVILKVCVLAYLYIIKSML